MDTRGRSIRFRIYIWRFGFVVVWILILFFNLNTCFKYFKIVIIVVGVISIGIIIIIIGPWIFRWLWCFCRPFVWFFGNKQWRFRDSIFVVILRIGFLIQVKIVVVIITRSFIVIVIWEKKNRIGLLVLLTTCLNLTKITKFQDHQKKT